MYRLCIKWYYGTVEHVAIILLINNVTYIAMDEYYVYTIYSTSYNILR